MSQEPIVDHPEHRAPPAEPPDNDHWRGVAGDLGAPAARPAAWTWVLSAVLVVGLLILGITCITTDTTERAPAPAQPPREVVPVE